MKRSQLHIKTLCLGILLALLGGTANLRAQQSAIDSLLRAGKKSQASNRLNDAIGNYFQAATILKRTENTAKLAKVYDAIGDIYTQVGMHRKAIEYYEQSLESEPDRVATVEALANALFQLRRFDESLQVYSSQALGLRIQEGNRKAILPIMERMVVCFNRVGKYQQALDNEFAILELSQILEDSSIISTTYNNLGYDYNFVGDYEQALFYLDKALASKKNNQEPISSWVPIMLNKAVVLQNIQEYKKAIIVLLDAVALAEQSQDPLLQVKAYQLVAKIYFNLGDYYNAEVYNNRLIGLMGQTYQADILSEAYLMATEIHQKVEEYQEALVTYERHLQIRDSLTLASRLRQQGLLQQQLAYERSERELRTLVADKERAALEAKQQQLLLERQKQEIAALEKQQALQDAKIRQQELEQLQAVQEQRILTQQLEAQKQAQRQAQQLDSLRQQEQLQRIELAQKEAADKEREAEIRRLGAENQLKEEQAKRQREASESQTKFFTTLSILGVILLSIILWAFFNTRNKNRELAVQQVLIRERNAELTQLNEEVSAQRDAVAAASEQLNIAYSQITDSVRYAQRIQNSILFHPKDIIQHFQEGFIMFLPREIVSGDFYWFSKKEDMLVITAIDCTGHGVPGAFMSLIGNDLLNDIVNLRDITDPAAILTELNEGVRRTLKQDQTDNQDGMDMALCVIDPNARELRFAGAKNPLVYVQGGELHHIKGDKMAIGGKQLYEAGEYQTHIIPIEHKTRFYLFSDGYQDQFGGPRNKKFMTKRLRNLLHEVHDKPMELQHELMYKALKEWQGAERQLDDILLMGFTV